MQLGKLDVYEEFQGYSRKTLRNAPYIRQWVTIGLQNRGSEDRQAGRLERALRELQSRVVPLGYFVKFEISI
jgi:hypothetical protein